MLEYCCINKWGSGDFDFMLALAVVEVEGLVSSACQESRLLKVMGGVGPRLQSISKYMSNCIGYSQWWYSNAWYGLETNSIAIKITQTPY